MLKIGIQYFGGRGGGGSAGGRGGSRAGGVESSKRSLSPEEIKAAESIINKKAFDKNGKNTWELTTDSKLGIGASITKEYENGKAVYYAQTWGKNVEDLGSKMTFNSLSTAKTACREEAKLWLNSVRVTK